MCNVWETSEIMLVICFKNFKQIIYPPFSFNPVSYLFYFYSVPSLIFLFFAHNLFDKMSEWPNRCEIHEDPILQWAGKHPLTEPTRVTWHSSPMIPPSFITWTVWTLSCRVLEDGLKTVWVGLPPSPKSTSLSSSMFKLWEPCRPQDTLEATYLAFCKSLKLIFLLRHSGFLDLWSHFSRI